MCRIANADIQTYRIANPIQPQYLCSSKYFSFFPEFATFANTFEFDSMIVRVTYYKILD